MYPTTQQIEGAEFLASRRTALLADEPGYGKTAQAIIACDLVGARSILVITTASARANWLAEFEAWSLEQRSAAAIYEGHTASWAASRFEVLVVSWALVATSFVLNALMKRRWDVLILDESHYCANVETDGKPVRRTVAVLGKDGIASRADRVWCLTGTPIPNTPDDIYPTLRALAPSLLKVPQWCVDPNGRRFPDVSTYETFLARYCVTERRQGWFGKVKVRHVAGQNLAELNERLQPFMLARKMSDLPPLRVSVFTVESDGPVPHDADEADILAAAETGTTDDLDMHIGPLMRITGRLKAAACAERITDEQNAKRRPIVLFYRHVEAGDVLERALQKFKPVRVDGSVVGRKRAEAIYRFQSGQAGIFLAQIQACSEAITLTAANEAMFVECSFVPAQMTQALFRIYRRGQTRPCLVRVAALRGSIDEALMRVVTRKTVDIRAIMESTE